MTRGIFDPTGDNTEHSGSTHLGPEASDISHLPPDVADGGEDSDGPPWPQGTDVNTSPDIDTDVPHA
jgi:hypothetical protein